MPDLRSLIVHTNPKSPVAESYRVLRTNIQFASIDKPVKVIAVTSSSPGEGKTTTIANLAITFAQSGSRVLVIDADLRKPRIHKVFYLSNVTGMTTVLAQRIDADSCITQTTIDNLFVLPAGPIPPNPSELLASNAMKNLMEELKNGFDIILIDAPPIGVVTDAAILSTIVDGTILVVGSGSVEIEAAQRAKDLLEKVNANVLGVVLNKIAKENYGNYYFSYYYYAEDKDGEKKTGKKHKSRKKKKGYFTY
ncbi:MAG: capsular biosynthesis protein [Clostridia bacterium]|jgi:capsular exopolysaccharide synthesis family protein|nr:capsular biosynthesis protein [Clostridia bacterium]